MRALKHIVLPSVLRKVSLFLTVGDENERYFEHYRVSRDRFWRVPFSIDSFYYDKILEHRVEVRSDVRRRLNLAPDTVVILTAGKMIARKNQADLVHAFGKAIKGNERSAVLLIAGDGPDRGQLEEIAKPWGDAVKLLGFIGVNELPEYYAASDIYVHPSSHDPHPLAISEALYCGLPIVVSNRGGSAGPTDDVQAGKNGWVYPLGDVAALARVLAELMDDTELRKRAAAESFRLGPMHSARHTGARFIDGALLAMTRR